MSSVNRSIEDEASTALTINNCDNTIYAMKILSEILSVGTSSKYRVLDVSQ